MEMTQPGHFGAQVGPKKDHKLTEQKWSKMIVSPSQMRGVSALLCRHFHMINSVTEPSFPPLHRCQQSCLAWCSNVNHRFIYYFRIVLIFFFK